MEDIKLTGQQELFCQWYTTKGDTYSNNTLSYAKAYDYELPLKADGEIDTTSKEYVNCKASGSRLYFNDYIRLRIRGILLARFNDNAVADARMQEIIESGKDTDSIQAAKVLNDLKQRITKKLDITSGGRPLAGLSDEELDKLAE